MTHPAHLAAFTLCALASAPALCAGAAPSLDDELRALVLPQVALPATVPDRARVQLEIGRIDPRLKLAPCRRIEPRWLPQSRAWGRTHVALRCVDGERPWQVYLPLSIKVMAPALVPLRALPAGAVLAEADLGSAEVDWAAAPRPPFTRAADLVGRTLARAVAAGQGLAADDIRLRHWFASGDMVKVVARGSGFAVSGEAQAMGAGIEGQVVRVRTESGRVLSGTAVGERRVEVLL